MWSRKNGNIRSTSSLITLDNAMKKLVVLILIIFTFTASGCATRLEVVNMNPTGQGSSLERTAIPDLAGRWLLKELDEVWEFTPSGTSYYKDNQDIEPGWYALHVVDSKGRQGELGANLFNLDGVVFMEQLSEDTDKMVIEIPFNFPVNTIYMITQSESAITLKGLNAKVLQKITLENPEDIEFKIFGDRLLIHSESEHMVEFLRSHLHDKKLFSDKDALHLVREEVK
jgi:hypothetical protein